MISKYMKNAVILTVAATVFTSGTIYAANEKAATPKESVPSSLDGDEVTYDMRTGVVTATGNVLMTHGDAKLTGKSAEFNLKTHAGNVIGDVIAVQKDMRMTADKCTSDGEHIVAEGKVVQATKADKTYTGPRVDYFQSKEYILMEQGGVVTSTAGESFTADRMEGWSKNNYAKGTGNAHLISPPNKLEASGDVVDYYGKVKGSEEPAKAFLTGNAWAVQDNNTLRGKRLVVYLADKDEKTAKVENADNKSDKKAE